MDATEMQPLANAPGPELSWVRTGWGAGLGTYELRAGQTAYAGLTFAGLLGAGAVATTAGACWNIRPIGMSALRIEVEDAGNGSVVATYARSALRGPLRGRVRFHDRHTYRWLRRGAWAPIWEFTTESALVIMSITEKIEIGMVLRLEDAPASQADVPLLAVLGWYLSLGEQEEERRRWGLRRKPAAGGTDRRS